MPSLFHALCTAQSELIDELQRFVQVFCKARFSPRICERVRLTTHELLENAIKYGSITGDIQFELLLNDVLEIRVANDSVPTRIEMLKNRLVELEKAPADAMYQATIRDIARGKHRPMLGLARIRHEAEMALELKVSGRRVTICAYARDISGSRSRAG